LESTFRHRSTQSQAVARLALEAIATGLVTTGDRLEALAKSTLAQVQGTDLFPLLRAAVRELVEAQLIEISMQQEVVRHLSAPALDLGSHRTMLCVALAQVHYTVTKKGAAACGSALSAQGKAGK
jgi:hypothetical protein